MADDVREIGSWFEWRDIPVATHGDDTLRLPANHVLLASGRSALALVAESLATRTVLHVPAYLCPDVRASLARNFELRTYLDLPTETEPDWDTLTPTPHEAVLAVNYFGLRASCTMQAWKERYPASLLIEDQTHAPFGPWASESAADFVVASLRKHLPIPDGAYCFSPTDHPLALPSEGSCVDVSRFLEAAALKSLHVRGGKVERNKFLKGFARHERQFDALEGPVSISDFSRSVLAVLDVRGMCERRAANLAGFTEGFAHLERSGIATVLRPADALNAYNPVLVFATAEHRDRFRRILIESGVFAPVHWKVDATGTSPHGRLASELSKRVLTVPLDHRYGAVDVARVVGVLGEVMAIDEH